MTGLQTDSTLSGFLPDECVDFGDVDVVQLLDSVLDLMLVGLDIHDEYQCVVVLNLLHRRLCRQGELDDSIVIQPTEKQCINITIHLSLLWHMKNHEITMIKTTLNRCISILKAGIILFHTLIA